MKVALILALLALVGLALYTRSRYELAPIQTQDSTDPSGLWALKHSVSCTGGVGENNDGMYSSNKGPGGICSTGPFVQKGASYTIVDGIGGSLLAR